MKRSVRLNGLDVPYTLERKGVKNLNLRIRAGEVYVSASRWVPVGVIESFLQSRAEFILDAIERSGAKRVVRFAEGERFFYRGRSYPLALSRGAKNEVCVLEGKLLLSLREPADEALARRVLQGWYRAESERLCRLSCARLLPCFAPWGVPQEIEIRMRVMRSCWGNCRPSRRIVTFNAFLAAVPDESLDYVVAHELTHFLHADHSAAFYAALARVMPDWKPRRAALKDYQAVPF